MIKLFTNFTGSGSLSLVAYWTILAGAWTRAGGYVEASGSLNTDQNVVHSTDAGYNLPSTHTVSAIFEANVGAKYFGVCTMADSSNTSSTRIEARWREDFGQQFELLVPGFSAQIVTKPNHIDYANPQPTNISLVSEYQGMNAGKPEFIFRIYADGQLVLASPPRRLAYWSSTMYHHGMTARRESFGSPTPYVRVFEFSTDVPGAAVTHEPMPTVTTQAARTPITVGDEKPNASPSTFPFEIRIASVGHQRHTRRMLTDMGYDVSHPRLANARRFFDCAWVGDHTDADTVEAFFDSRDGSYDNFEINIRALGIGTVDVAFLEYGAMRDVSKGIRRIEFKLVELL